MIVHVEVSSSEIVSYVLIPFISSTVLFYEKLASEAATRVVLTKLFLKISQYPQENTCVRVSF